MEHILDGVRSDAAVLCGAGFDAVIVENFGDAPFHGERVEPHTVSAMTRCARAALEAGRLQVGVNVLRNDALAALGVAAAAGAGFIRVNIHTGVYATDQGLITGCAAEILRHRARVAPGVQIWADIHVKHAQPLSQPDIALAAEETAYRGHADALIVTGSTTGRPADRELLHRVRAAVPDRPILLGSGATASTVAQWMEVCDGVIVGSDLREGGRAGARLDVQRVRRFADAAGA